MFKGLWLRDYEGFFDQRDKNSWIMYYFYFKRCALCQYIKTNYRLGKMLVSCYKCSITLLDPNTIVMNGYFLAAWYEEIGPLVCDTLSTQKLFICAFCILIKIYLARDYSPELIKIFKNIICIHIWK